MKFLIFFGPIIKFLVNKYTPSLASYPQSSELINKFISTKILLPPEAITFIKVLQNLRTYLVENNLTFRIDSIQNYVGDDTNYDGLLNVLLKQGHEIYICEYDTQTMKNLSEQIRETFKGGPSDLKVIAPITLEDVRELHELFVKDFKIPIYPLSSGFITSKWLINFTFMTYAPRTFYFPINTNALDYIEKIRTIAKNENINYLILKDEFDFDIRDIIPYSVTSIEKLDYFCAFFYEKSKGISNVGGLVLEEFLYTKNIIQLYKSFIYNDVIPEYGISNETKLKSFSTGDFLHLIIESIKEEITPKFTQYNSIFNPVINRYYRYLLSSIDYIIKDNHPNVIDFNGIVSTLKYLQKEKKKFIDEFFNNFITKVMAEKNEDALVMQQTYISIMTHFYNAIQKLGPSFIAGDRYINLNTLSERSLHEIIKEILINEAETPNKT